MRTMLIVALYVLASTGRCNAPVPGPPPAEPRPGDSVEIRGRLAEDVDCRLLRAESGRVYSLTERLPNLRDGSRVCVLGTIAVASHCMHAPTIEVVQIRPWSSCR